MKYGDHSSPRSTISLWLFENTAKLKSAGIESARLDCLILLEKVLEKTRTWLVAHDDNMLTSQQTKILDTFITQRQNRTPLAYIIGAKEFYGRSFLVNESVLIPRPESESIIELIKETNKVTDINTVFDIGTGSGCLAITIKKELPDIHVTGIDISGAALQVAKKNARQLTAQIQWRQLDIEEDGLPPMPKTRPYVIVANLPYVPGGLITSPEITKEPGIALFSGVDGLDHYRALWQKISAAKNKPFAIITESLEGQHAALQHMAAAAGYQVSATQGLVQQFTQD